MISQNPYNNLPFLKDYTIHHTQALLRDNSECMRSLWRLDGFLEAAEEENRGFASLIQVAEAKYSFELENLNIALGRLYEALASENLLRDKMAELVQRYLLRSIGASADSIAALEPLFQQADAKPGDFLREKKELRISSHYTGLALYSAPSNPQIIRSLRSELDTALKAPPGPDFIIRNGLLHLQLRALSPYQNLNGHAARHMSKLLLRRSGFLTDVLPLSAVIIPEREQYNTLLRTAVLSGDATEWCRFMCNCISLSARLMLLKLKSMQAYKKQLRERVFKYTEYPLPAHELAELLCKSPYIKPAGITAALGCHRQTAYTYLAHLQGMGILSEKQSGREKLYLHKALLDILLN